MFRTAFLLLGVAVLAAAELTSISYDTCGGSALDVRVEGCNSDPCVLKRGATYRVEVDFESPVTADDCQGSLTGKVLFVWAPFPGLDRNCCHGLKPGCPLKKGAVHTYTVDLPITKAMPKISTTARGKAYGGGQELFCIKMAVKVGD